MANLFLIILSFSLFSLVVATDFPSCNPADEAVLLKVRDRFGGPNGRLSDWTNSSNCCSDWSFVGCNSRTGRITTVTISRSWGLSGILPDELADLPFLSFLSFAEEPNVTGPIPQSFSKLKRLERLELDGNSLTGPIPTFLGQLKKLSYLNVSHNSLTGSIPALPAALTTFDVSYNQLCGIIPDGVKKFGKSAFEHNRCLCGPPLPTNCH